MKKASKISEFQRLCSIGTEGLVLLPRLLESMHEILPTSHNAFFWLNSDYSPAGGYHEIDSHAQYAHHYVMSFANNLETEAIPSLRTIVQSQRDIFLSSANESRVANSKLYDEVWRPINCFHVVEVGVGQGVLMLIREKAAGRFHDNDLQTVQSVVPHMKAAFLNGRVSGAFTDQEGQECLILNKHGKIEFQTSGVEKLIDLCSGKRFVTNDANINVWKCDVRMVIRHLAQRLREIDRGRPSPPCVFRHRNPWGEFEFLARMLDGADPSSSGKPIIFIRHKVPTALWYVEEIKQLPLTEKEKDIVLLSLTQDLGKSEIAAKLQISHHTVTTHFRHIYDKLKINSRAGLKRILLKGRSN